jgi:hypothetical protein
METQDEEKPADPPTKAKPITVTLRLTPGQHDALRRVAYETRTSINRLMMDGLAEVLRRHGR